MVFSVILEADWFVIEGRNYLKKLAYCCPSLEKFGEYSFSLPEFACKHQRKLLLQARHSHGLVWHSFGEYSHYQVPVALEELFQKLGKRPCELKFYAKGDQKCELLEKFVPEVSNLEDFDCPTYEKISLLPKSTINKAVFFGLWLVSSMSPTSLQLRKLAVCSI